MWSVAVEKPSTFGSGRRDACVRRRVLSVEAVRAITTSLRPQMYNAF